MINLFTYSISFFIGFLIIRFILGEKTNISLFLHCALSVGLGLGVCAITTFLFLLIFGQFSQAGLITTNALLLLILGALNFLTLPKNSYLPPLEKMKHETAFNITALAFCLLTAILISILSQQFSFGGWDAWGLYNMKAKFLIYGGKNWTDVAKVHWHTQPSYPLLLPLINTWIFSVFQKNLIEVASMTGVIFSISCGLLLYAGLSLFIQRPIAFLASLLLLTTPSYIFWGTVQYADVLLAYYLLASIILLILTLRTLKPRMALLAGLFWGMMPFAKNEGIVMLVLFIVTTSGLLLLDKTYHRAKSLRLIKNLLLGASATVFMNLVFKIFLAPATREILFNPLTRKLPYCNFEGFLTTVLFFIKTIMSLGWILTWILIGLLAIANYKKWFALKEARILALIFAGFSLSLLYVYMTTVHFDLAWRLECTSTRISFYLLPAALFISFYTFWTKTPKN